MNNILYMEKNSLVEYYSSIVLIISVVILSISNMAYLIVWFTGVSSENYTTWLNITVFLSTMIILSIIGICYKDLVKILK